MSRIVIIGVTGTGKSTLAFNIAAKTKLPITELDDLYWRPNWQPAPLDEFRRDVSKMVSGDKWITTGNYKDVRDILWNRADTLIWLDYSFPTALWRLTTRTIQRVWDKKPVCNGNTESLSNIFSKNGIIPWLFETYGPRKREYGAIFSNADEYPHLEKFRLRNQKETDAFIDSLKPTSPI